jgi:hypothetical protein
VDEYVCALLALNEAESLGLVEPLDGTDLTICHDFPTSYMLGVSFQQNVLGGTKNNLFSKSKRLQDCQQRQDNTAWQWIPQCDGLGGVAIRRPYLRSDVPGVTIR